MPIAKVNALRELHPLRVRNCEDPKGLSREPSSCRAGESRLWRRESVKETLRVSNVDSQSLRNLQSSTDEELRPYFGRTLTSSPSAASGMPSVLRPQGGAFKSEL